MGPVQDLNRLFAKVVDFGSHTTAGKALGLQTSKLSRHIASLESELGVRLINRTTRRLSLAEAAGEAGCSHFYGNPARLRSVM